MEEKTEKKFFKINLIAFELVALDTPFTEREHLPSGVNMLTKSLKISDTTKTKFTEVVYFHSDQKIWEKYCRSGLSNLSDPLTCWLSIIVLRRGFLGI